jgi:hypothetical protein
MTSGFPCMMLCATSAYRSGLPSAAYRSTIRFLPSANPIWRSRLKSTIQGSAEKPSIPDRLQTARRWTLACSAACNVLAAVVANNPARTSRLRIYAPSSKDHDCKNWSLPLCLSPWGPVKRLPLRVICRHTDVRSTPAKADILTRVANVRLGPHPDSCAAANRSSIRSPRRREQVSTAGR